MSSPAASLTLTLTLLTLTLVFRPQRRYDCLEILIHILLGALGFDHMLHKGSEPSIKEAVRGDTHTLVCAHHARVPVGKVAPAGACAALAFTLMHCAKKVIPLPSPNPMARATVRVEAKVRVRVGLG